MISNSPAHLTHPKYRPDIDGLRAIAILPVVGFHAFPNQIHGGFIGVDIFFVISGYLISTIIMGSLERDSFNLAEFYIRRINRIFPALLLVLMACFAFGWFTLLADEYKQLGKHIVGSAGFISNYMYGVESGYFDNAAETKPLLHLWSLGIEEQYYVVWPLLLWFVWKKKFNLLIVILLVALISFGLNIAKVSGGHFVEAFYLPQTRFWELLIGSVLAETTLHHRNMFAGAKHQLDVWLGKIAYAHVPEANGKTLRNVSSLLGAAFLVVGFALITRERSFPGWWAILPTLGTVLIISAGTQAYFNRIVLSNRVLVWFGLISFPLYLWHWPLLSFAHIINGETPPISIRIAAILISVLLAYVTYKLIEKPIRLSKYSQAKSILLIILMIIVGYGGYYLYRQDGLSDRSSIRKVSVQLEDLKINMERGQGWYCQEDRFKDANCYFNAGAIPTAVVIGDSHSTRMYLGLKELYKQKGVYLANFGGGGGCPPFLNVISKRAEVSRNCLEITSKALEVILSDYNIKDVILVNRGPMYSTKSGFGKINANDFGSWTITMDKESEGKRTNLDVYRIAMTQTLAALQKAGKHVTYVHNVPELGFDILSCVDSRPYNFERTVRSPCAVSKDAYIERNKEHRALVDDVLKKFPYVRVVDPAEALCDDLLCYGKIGKHFLYTDDNHLSKRGAELVAQKLKSKFLD